MCALLWKKAKKNDKAAEIRTRGRKRMNRVQILPISGN